MITDDFSQDKTVDIIKTFDDQRIRLFQFSENRGASFTNSHCIQQCRGEYIAELNSDDKFKPQKLEKQIHFLDKNSNIDVVFSYAQLIDNSGKSFLKNHFYKHIFYQPNRTPSEWLNYFFYQGNCLCHPSHLIRKSCFDKVGYFNPILAQLFDLDLWVKLCINGYNIHIIPEELIEFRIQDGEANASGDRPEVYIRCAIEIQQILKNYLHDSVLDDILQIFPNAKTVAKIPEEIDIDRIIAKYILAQLSLNHPINYCRYFGINLLYELMADDETQSILYNKLKFNYRDLIKITGKIDALNMDIGTELIRLKGSRFWKIWEQWQRFKLAFPFLLRL